MEQRLDEAGKQAGRQAAERTEGRKEGRKERIPFDFARWTVTLRSEIGRLIARIKLGQF